ncbi:MAG: glycosyltransferase family 9 protein [Zetaproteobacteria bacterium]|nr:glycosyltransferase family 9 protein [Zetaproteobacteria bacterium]
MNYQSDCRLFTGYKPCRYQRPCDIHCPHYDPVDTRILIISLDAMGAVLRATSLLPAIQRQYPEAHITWLTLPQCAPLLQENTAIDRVLTLNHTTTTVLSVLKFAVLYAVDKSIQAGALAEQVDAPLKYGFGLDTAGNIRPLSPHANYQFQLGLDNDLKFYKNKQPETEQLANTMNLTWRRDPYQLHLNSTEQAQVKEKRRHMLRQASHPQAWIIGYNTGCSNAFPYKKFRLSRAIETIQMWRARFPTAVVALCGGPEDTQRQQQMKSAFATDSQVINTETTAGLRDGITSLAACDIIFSGCSLGMHIAIALQKPTIAWFGLSCAQEIDLYERGIKLRAKVSCSPCWRKSCDKEPKCFDEVSPTAIGDATQLLQHKYIRDNPPTDLSTNMSI